MKMISNSINNRTFIIIQISCGAYSGMQTLDRCAVCECLGKNEDIGETFAHGTCWNKISNKYKEYLQSFYYNAVTGKEINILTEEEFLTERKL